MVAIPEYKRDENRDYLSVLKSLNEIPFCVGRNLLCDFLIGVLENKSIVKNNLSELINFSSLKHLSRRRVLEIIDDLVTSGFVSSSSSLFNEKIKVLGITQKGKGELLNPSRFDSKLVEERRVNSNYITYREMKVFSELQKFLDGYNKDQKKAIVCSDPTILCVAGAGSGKTSVLTKRIEFLSKYEKVRNDEILAVTFTKKAKVEMEERLCKVGLKVHVHTFNSFCERILLKYQHLIYDKKMKVVSYSEKLQGVLMGLDYLGLSMDEMIDRYYSLSKIERLGRLRLKKMFVDDCFSVLDYYVATKKDLSEYLKNVDSKYYEVSKLVYELVMFLSNYMKVQGFRTYGDQVRDCLNFLRNNPSEIPVYQHVLVDEYQDVNSLQVELLDLLNPDNLFCVGDPRQSIFGFRGSNVDFILNFGREYKATVINLKSNYRSSSKIVDLMNKAVLKMQLPSLDSEVSFEGSVALHKFDEFEDEINFVVERVKNIDMSSDGVFVVCRTNSELLKVAERFKEEGVDYFLKVADSQDDSFSAGEVVLSTVHSIKGLEADYVFLLGSHKLNFPSRSVDHPVVSALKMYSYDVFEEERRLFYVGISRAKSELCVCFSRYELTPFFSEEMVGMVGGIVSH